MERGRFCLADSQNVVQFRPEYTCAGTRGDTCRRKPRLSLWNSGRAARRVGIASVRQDSAGIVPAKSCARQRHSGCSAFAYLSYSEYLRNGCFFVGRNFHKSARYFRNVCGSKCSPVAQERHSGASNRITAISKNGFFPTLHFPLKIRISTALMWPEKSKKVVYFPDAFNLVSSSNISINILSIIVWCCRRGRCPARIYAFWLM